MHLHLLLIVMSREIENLPESFELQKRFMIKEYELKIDAKKQNLEFLRNLILHNLLKQETANKTSSFKENDINSSNIINNMNVGQSIISEEQKLQRGSITNPIKGSENILYPSQLQEKSKIPLLIL